MTEVECVYCAVRTKSLCTADVFRLEKVNAVCDMWVRSVY